MSDHDDIHFLKLLSDGDSSIIDVEESAVPNWTRACNLGKLVEMVKAKAALYSCNNYPHCESCEDAGLYRYCKIDFRIGSNEMRLLFKDCTTDGMHISAASIYAKPAMSFFKIIERLKFPRYCLENVPQELKSGLVDVLSNQSTLKVLELREVDLTKSTTELLRNVLVQSSSLEEFHLVECYLYRPPEVETNQNNNNNNNETDDDDSDDEQNDVQDNEAMMMQQHDTEDPEYAQKLGEGFREAKSLKVLRFTYCGISDTTMALFVTDSIHRLEKLTIAGNGCGTQSMQAIGAALQRTDCELEYLNASYLGENVPIAPLARALTQNTSLTELNLSWNPRLENEGVECLATALKTNNTLAKIVLENHEDAPSMFSVRGWEVLGEGLRHARGLKYLDISYNEFQDDRALTTFAEGLRINSSITNLIMKGIQASSEQGYQLLGRVLCEVLTRKDTILKELDLSYNDEFSLRDISEALTGNRKLEKLHLHGLSSKDMPVLFFTQLHQMRGLKELYLDRYDDDDVGALVLQQIVSNKNIMNIHGMENNASWKMIDYYLRLNRGGRKHLHSSLLNPLWPLVLEKSNNDLDVLYHFITEEVVPMNFSAD